MNPERILVDRGLVTPEQLERAALQAREGNQSVFDSLLGDGILTGEQLGWHVADAHRLPFVRLAAALISTPLAWRVGEAELRRRLIVPLEPDPDGLTVAVADPALAGPPAVLARLFGCATPVFLAVAEPGEVRLTLDKIFGGSAAPAVARADEGAHADPHGVRTFYTALIEAGRRGADRLRFDPATDGYRVVARIDGHAVLLRRIGAEAGRVTVDAGSALLDDGERGDLRATIDGLAFHLKLTRVPTMRGAALLVDLQGDVVHGCDREALDQAALALLNGPVLLVTHGDSARRWSLARDLVAAAPGLFDPVVTLVKTDAFPDAVVAGTNELSILKALRPRLLIVEDGQLMTEQLLALARGVPSVLLLREEVSAAAALASCAAPLRPFLGGAVDSRRFLEARSWTS